MFKVNNRNTRFEICSKLTIKTSERHDAWVVLGNCLSLVKILCAFKWHILFMGLTRNDEIKTKRYVISSVSDVDVGESWVFFNAELKILYQQFCLFHEHVFFKL